MVGNCIQRFSEDIERRYERLPKRLGGIPADPLTT